MPIVLIYVSKHVEIASGNQWFLNQNKISKINANEKAPMKKIENKKESNNRKNYTNLNKYNHKYHATTWHWLYIHTCNSALWNKRCKNDQKH